MGKKEELPAQPKQRRKGSGVWEKGEGGLPFIEPSSGHVRLHQQMAERLWAPIFVVFPLESDQGYCRKYLP